MGHRVELFPPSQISLVDESDQTLLQMATEREPIPKNQAPSVDDLRDLLTPQRFRDWYRERQYRQNIENGQHYFNDAASTPDPPRHSPSQLLQCHRKVVYRQENAPQEQSDPTGIFWFGTRFEEDIVFPFFRDVLTDEDTYVRNSVWIDFTETTAVGDIRIKGATDPLIVAADAVPLLPTEIKTKSSVDYVTEANPHHRAQLHAYMRGLSEKYDVDITEGVIVYGGRDSLDIEVVHLDFDEEFWQETILAWAETHTTFRVNETLPPAEPEHDWECGVCSYRERCGRGETAYEDVGTVGLLQTYDDYPPASVKEYLDAYPAARLPPTLANSFPEIAAEYGVADWLCIACGYTADPETIAEGDETAMRGCPDCSTRDVFGQLVSPSPHEQARRMQARTDGEADDA